MKTSSKYFYYITYWILQVSKLINFVISNYSNYLFEIVMSHLSIIRIYNFELPAASFNSNLYWK